MNKEDLLKLKEILKRDKTNIIPNINLSDDYIIAMGKDNVHIDDCTIMSAKEILANKKAASVVVDRLVSDYTHAIYAFHHLGLDEYNPVVTFGIDFIYKFNSQMIGTDGIITVDETNKPLGDIISFTNDLPQPLDEEFIGDIGTKELHELNSLYKNLCLSNHEMRELVSFNELITELTARGFYCDYDDFKTLEEDNGIILHISTEPFIKENKNIK